MIDDSKFNEEQLAIINSTEQHQLVSAGAGSGKTTVLIEKLTRLIVNEHVPINNLLVVTFTVFAAEEMKSRLIKSLQEELLKADTKERAEEILSSIEQVKVADISTIDGFASKNIKKYFYELEIEPSVEIISDSTRDYYMTRAMKKSIEELTQEEEKINLLLDIFGKDQRNLSNLESFVLNTYFDVINLEDYEEFINKSKLAYIKSDEAEKIVNNLICATVEKAIKTFECDETLYDVDVESLKSGFLNEFKKVKTTNNLKENLQALFEMNIETFNARDSKRYASLKILNGAIKDVLDRKNKLQERGIDTDFEEKSQKVLAYFNYFIELLQKFIKNYADLKAKNNLLDFNDLTRLMLKLLKNEKIKAELHNKYKYIFVDECQDINPLQDKLLCELCGKDAHTFMVGDVKQSIYGFRGAVPELFLEKYDAYKKHHELGKAFDMKQNYRSNPKILKFIDEKFSDFMTKSATGIDYKNDCTFKAGLDFEDDKVQIALIEKDEEDEIATGVYSVKEDSNLAKESSKVEQARYVVNKITSLVGTEIYDAKQKQMRKLTYADIAILSRSEKDEATTILVDMLRQAGVPVNVNQKLEVVKSELVSLVLSILKCVVKTADDVDYLATFMALTPMTMDNLVALRTKDLSLYEDLCNNKDDEIVKIGFEKLKRIEQASYTCLNNALIRFILSDIGLKYYILSKPEGKNELAVLNEFLNKLSAENNLGLCEFISVVESSISKGTDFNSQDAFDSVTVQTIHKSKGLEYPVVFLVNANKQFNSLNENDEVNFASNLGIGVNYFDVLNRTKSSSLLKYAIRENNKKKGKLEEMRLLYVALTRAKNKLFIVGTLPKLAQGKTQLEDKCFTNMLVKKNFNELTKNHNEFDYFDVDIIGEQEHVLQAEKQDVKLDSSNLNFAYDKQTEFNVPIKNTVTALNTKRSEEEHFSTKAWLTPQIQAEAEVDRAMVGTHYHAALENLDYLTEFKKTTDFEDVDYFKIEQAHKKLQPLFTGSISHKKEADFMMYVPYNELVGGNIKDKVLVQGVVDLLIEYADGFAIVDYKFSSLPIGVLKQKYAEQLALYKHAVELAYGKPVKNTYIYSINTGEMA